MMLLFHLPLVCPDSQNNTIHIISGVSRVFQICPLLLLSVLAIHLQNYQRVHFIEIKRIFSAQPQVASKILFLVFILAIFSRQIKFHSNDHIVQIACGREHCLTLSSGLSLMQYFFLQNSCLTFFKNNPGSSTIRLELFLKNSFSVWKN